MERERERETGYSNFRSRDKRSVLTRCSSNKQAESFSISSRLLYWESLAARITRGILPENTILHSKDRRTDALPLWIADSYGIRMNRRGCWAPIYAYIHELSSASSRENPRKDPEKAKQFSPFPFFPRIRLNERSAIPSTNLVQPISQSEIPFNAIDTSRFICTKQRTFPRPWGEDPR